MNIKIDGKWTITTDNHNFIINETKVRGENAKNPGEEYLSVVGCYSDFEAAMNAIPRHTLLRCNAKSLDDVMAELRRIREIVEAEIGKGKY